MPRESSALPPHFCSASISYMAIALIEWAQFFKEKQRDDEPIRFRHLVKAAGARLVYFNLLTVFFALYYGFSRQDFMALRRHRDSLYYLVQMATAFEKGFKDLGSFTEWQKSHLQAAKPRLLQCQEPVCSGREAAQEQTIRSRFALYVSNCGEKILRSLISNCSNSRELTRAVEKAETFTAQETTLRIWYGSHEESPVGLILHMLRAKASEHDYKFIISHPEGHVEEAGLFEGPLRLRPYSDFDYDLSQADGTSWLCRSCSEVDNDYSDHGFVREWEAVEILGRNGHSLGSHLTKHVNSEVFCKACGCYNVIDEKTGREVN